MAISRIKTFVDGEVLFAADINAEFNNIVDDTGIEWPATVAKDLDGNNLILDGDGDTLLKASTDDVFELVSQTATTLKVDGSVASVVNGLVVTATATGTPPSIGVNGDTNLDLNLVPAGTGVVAIEGALFATHTDAVLANQVFGS